MKAFLEPMESMHELAEIYKKAKKTNGIYQITGCIDAGKAHLIYSLSVHADKRVVITHSEQRARELVEEYRFFDRQAVYYPARDILFYQSDLKGNLLARERLTALRAVTEQENVTFVTTFDALMDRLIRPEVYQDAAMTFAEGDTVELKALTTKLVQLGYERNYQVEDCGQFAVRGGIVDVYPLTAEAPYRIELWGDEIDSIRIFEVEGQRSLDRCETVTIDAACEMLVTKPKIDAAIKRIKKEAKELSKRYREEMKTQEAFRIEELTRELTEQLEQSRNTAGLESFISYFQTDTVSILDYFDPAQTQIFLDEPVRLIELGQVVEQEFTESMQQRLEKGYILPGQMEAIRSLNETSALVKRFKVLALATLDMKANGLEIAGHGNIAVKSISPYNNSFELLVKDLKQYKKKGYRIILLSGSKTRAKRLAEDLQENEISSFYTEDYDHIVQLGEVMVAYGKLKKGYEYPEIQFAVISESDIFGQEKKKKKKRRQYEGEHIADFSELKVGDYVVHENHGLGIYRGIEKVEIDKNVKDYIKIEYAKGGNLYIQATQLELIQKYASADAKKPKLNRLGGIEWEKTKTKVRGAVQNVAKELVELYALRQQKQGFQCGPDTVWQREFEEMFPFEETADQVAAIEDTKRDMESAKIMDRLICGDVGYGKTEIAIRAAFKAIQEGKQVVYLVPTTILAQQHYNTFSQRMKDFPVRVDLLCRFRSAKEQKQTIEDLKKGQVDVVVGTHRVLSKDVQFKDLGLLIVDEEQRFGVTHKEKIKQLKKDVDVLTLTATPIPRTLHMSLIGIRDMSVLEEPPMDRMPIQTYVMEYNEELVREAVRRELARNGQVYYVYNRVNQIEDIAHRIEELVPDAVVAYAHGQMREQQLEKIMYGFINGEIDVLVSTTIIETGLDISNVNTMIIQDADNLGLSQLYQLRGRVGRSNRTSYAFLMYKRDKMLKEVAEKRLAAIKEYTELGSGFKIAMRDLEIRGAGNLLGAQQHGHMEAVGYDLYCKMLNEAVKTMKGIATEDHFDTSIDIRIDAYIPMGYIPNEQQKLDIYKRIAGVENEEEGENMLDELIDRFGEPPTPVTNLLQIAKVKALAHACYYTEIVQKGEELRFTMYEKAKVNPAAIPDLLEKYHGALKFQADVKAPYFSYLLNYNSRKKNEIVMDCVEHVVTDTYDLLVEKNDENEKKD